MKKLMAFLILTLAVFASQKAFAHEDDMHHGTKSSMDMPAKSDSDSKSEIGKAVYSCPMHPEVKQDQAGKCPKCGMKLEMMSKEDEEKAEKETPEHSGMQDMAGHDMHSMSDHKN